MLNRTGWTNHQALEITEFEDKEAPLAEIGEVGQETEVSSSFIVSESVRIILFACNLELCSAIVLMTSSVDHC